MAKTKVLISFAVTVKLICSFVYAYALCWFSHDAAYNIMLDFQITAGIAKISMLSHFKYRYYLLRTHLPEEMFWLLDSQGQTLCAKRLVRLIDQ